jgi:hypothetical protein
MIKIETNIFCTKLHKLEVQNMFNLVKEKGDSNHQETKAEEVTDHYSIPPTRCAWTFWKQNFGMIFCRYTS